MSGKALKNGELESREKRRIKPLASNAFTAVNRYFHVRDLQLS
jgi:hypothetical protein